MKTDLVIHAGLSKTATTTVQYRLMRGAAHYLGRTEDGDGIFVPELMELARRWPFLPGSEVSARTRAWAEKAAARSGAVGGAPVLALSCEQLLNWRIYDNDFRKGPLAVSPRGLPWRQARRQGRWPLAVFLADHLVPAWSRYGDVRVAVTLRRQPDWLASHYAQISSRIWNPCQADFESQVRELISRGDSYLFWDSLVSDLEWAASPRNLHVFLYEDLAKVETWTKLAVCLGLAADDQRIEDARQARSNQRSAGAQHGWTIRQSRGRIAGQFLDICWPEGLLPPARTAAINAATACDRAVSGALASSRKQSGSQQIFLTGELTDMIRAYCQNANTRLSAMLGRDLESLGY